MQGPCEAERGRDDTAALTMWESLVWAVRGGPGLWHHYQVPQGRSGPGSWPAVSAGCEGARLCQQWGSHHQPAGQHPAQHCAAQQAARQHPPGQRGAAQPCRESGE